MNNKKSIVLFGDSHLGRFNRDRCKKLEKKIGNTTVYNCATGGWTTKDGMERAQYIAKLKPQFVVLSFPGNDFIDCNKISAKESKENLKAIVGAFRDSKIILFLGPMADDRFEDGEFNQRLPEYNKAAGVVAEETGAYVIDGPKVYNKLSEDCHEDDGVHLSELGYDILIQELIRTIKKIK